MSIPCPSSDLLMKYKSLIYEEPPSTYVLLQWGRMLRQQTEALVEASLEVFIPVATRILSLPYGTPSWTVARGTTW